MPCPRRRWPSSWPSSPRHRPRPTCWWPRPRRAATALELQPDHPGAIAGLAAHLIAEGETDEAITLLGRIPETPETRLLLAEARLASQQVDVGGVSVEELLDGLLDRVRGDDEARQEFVDLLETLGPDDPRTAAYRKALSAKLF